MRVLRPYQIEAIEAIRKTLETSNSTVMVLPTGMGKTSVASRLMLEWPGGNCLFLAHTRELVDQAADRLEGELGYRPIVEMGLRGGDDNLFYQGGMVVVGSVQSMLTDRRLKKYEQFPFDLIVIDECHRATARSYRRVVDFFSTINLNCKVVGLTATPNRSDKQALGMVFDSVAYTMDIDQGIDGGWLVPVRERTIVVSDVEITGPLRTNEVGEKDWTDSQVEDVMLDINALIATADPLVREANGRQTLVFCATVRHAHELAGVIDRYAPGLAAAVDGETDIKTRNAIVSRFRKGELQFLCNACLFVEGFDSPSCSCVAIARPTKSTGRYTQCVGRGLRSLPGVVDGIDDATERKLAILTSDKPDCLILDFVNAGAVGLVRIDDVLGGDYDAEERSLALQSRVKGEESSVSESLKRARFLLSLERELASIEAINSNVRYHAADRDHRVVAHTSSKVTPEYRGTITDGQLGFLIALGIRRETAIKYSVKQAASVIDKTKATRCTVKQANVLRKAGIDIAGIGVDRAGRIITALAANGWRPLQEIPQ